MLGPHFRLIGQPQLRVDHPRFGFIDFRLLTEEQSLDLWQQGFEYIGITPEGVKKYLSKMNSQSVASLIMVLQDPSDVILVSRIKNTKSVEKAKMKRLSELAND